MFGKLKSFLRPQEFGCRKCFPLDKDAAKKAFKTLSVDSRLIDESHYWVILHSCNKCHQHFASVFTETIDWKYGNDPHLWCLLPITADERDQLQLASTNLENLETLLESLGRCRRSLWSVFPPGGAFWARGIKIGPHY